jgi:L-iditol 2-dehydrogenase
MRAGVKDGDTVLVSGAGPIGLLVGQWAMAAGASTVYFFDISAEKIDFAKSMGFYEYDDSIKVDVVIEGTGVGPAVERCLNAAKAGGTVLLLGNPSGDILFTPKTYWYILRKELTVKGTWNSSYASYQNDWKEGLQAVSEGKLNLKPLITHHFPLSECNTALEMMRDRTEFYNKVMLDL